MSTIKKGKNVSKQARKLFSYSEENLKLALQSVREEKMSIRTAAKHFSVPRTTLQDRISGKTPDKLRNRSRAYYDCRRRKTN